MLCKYRFPLKMALQLPLSDRMFVFVSLALHFGLALALFTLPTHAMQSKYHWNSWLKNALFLCKCGKKPQKMGFKTWNRVIWKLITPNGQYLNGRNYHIWLLVFGFSKIQPHAAPPFKHENHLTNSVSVEHAIFSIFHIFHVCLKKYTKCISMYTFKCTPNHLCLLSALVKWEKKKKSLENTKSKLTTEKYAKSDGKWP